MPRDRKAFSPSEIRNLAPVKWQIKGIMPERSFGRIWGEPNGGKSFVAFDMAAHIVMGMPWMGRRVQQGSVAYYMLEGFSGFRKRLRAWELHHGVELDEAGFVGYQELDLGNAEDVAAEIEELRSKRPSLIIVDTLSRSIPGTDEDKSKEMSAVVRSLDRMAAELGCSRVLIHHPKKTGGDRGSSVILGALDWDMRLDDPSSRGGEGVRKLVAMKQKEAPREDGDQTFFLKEVVLPDLDEDGENERSLVVVPVPLTGAAAATPPSLGDLRRATIIEHVQANPGCSANAAAKAAGGRKANTLDLINQLVAAGKLTDDDGLRIAEASS